MCLKTYIFKPLDKGSSTTMTYLRSRTVEHGRKFCIANFNETHQENCRADDMQWMIILMFSSK